MDSILRALAIYVALLLVLRVSGKRSLAQITTFDFVLLLIVAETTQQALLGDDFSVTHALLVILTLVGADWLLARTTYRWKGLERVINGTPLVIVEDGKPIADRMKRCRLNDADVLEEARISQGIERMDQIKYAVLEKSGTISIIRQ